MEFEQVKADDGEKRDVAAVPRLSRARLTRRSAVAGGALALLAVASAVFGVARCSRGDEDVPAEPSAGDAAAASGSGSAAAPRHGGKLTLYTSCSDSLVNAVVPAFSQETGIAVNVVQMTSAQCQADVAAEVEAGSPAADVVWGGDASWFANPQNIYERYFSAENSSVLDEWRATDGYVTSVVREVCAILVNRERAEEAGLQIGGYVDLLDPKLAGLVAMADPHADATALTQVEAVLAVGDALAAEGEPGEAAAAAAESAADAEAADATAAEASETPDDAAASDAPAVSSGSELLSALRAQIGGAPYETSEDVAEAVLSGAVVAGLVYEQQAAAAADLSDEVEVVYPAEGCLAAASCTAIARGCGNGEQARAWVDYVLTEACQRAAQDKAHARSVREGVAGEDGFALLESSPGREEALAAWDAL